MIFTKLVDLVRQEVCVYMVSLHDITDDTMKPLFASLRGDIHLAKGDTAAAKTAYQEALDAFEEGDTLQRRMMEIKLADLAGGEPS